MKVKVDELTEKAGHAILENVAHIIFGAVILLMIVISFVYMCKGDGKFDWFNFGINLVLQLSIFIPYRWRQKRLSGKADPYKNNKKLYGDRVEELHNKNELTKFAEFCAIKTEELKRTKQLAIVHAAGIDTEVFDSCIYDKLTEEQCKAIEKARRVKVKAVNPLCITSNSNHVKGYGVDFNEGAEDFLSIFLKLLPMFVWAGIATYLVIWGIQNGGIEAVVMIVFRIVMCLTAMFSGIMSGDGFVVKKDKVILRRIDFIELFHEWQEVQATNK
ncbi:MAG: hypothetical protein K2L51_01445 [Clostridiales bacterium]|nr:hypothetical protein [Clostridiales bacterium]